MEQKTTFLKMKMENYTTTLLTLGQQFGYLMKAMEKIHERYPQVMEVGAMVQMKQNFITAFENNVDAFQEVMDDIGEKEGILQMNQETINIPCEADKETKTWWRLWAEEQAMLKSNKYKDPLRPNEKENFDSDPEVKGDLNVTVPPIHIVKTRLQIAKENYIDLKKPMEVIAFENAIFNKYGYNPMTEARFRESYEQLSIAIEKYQKMMEESDITFTQIFSGLEGGGLG